MLYALLLFAEDPPAEKVENTSPFGTMLMPIIFLAIIFYFLIIVPNRKEKQQRLAMMSTLKKNDRIITSGGIIGVILNLRDGSEEVTIKSDETKLTILRSSIARVLTEPAKETVEAKAP